MQNDSDMKFTKKPFIKDVGRLGPRKIESNQFSTLDQSEIIKADKAQVYKSACCDRFVGKPHKAGLVDRLVQEHLCIHKNGETQDFITSFFHITRKDTFYHRAAFFLMCSYMGDSMDYVDLPAPAIIKPIELWSGKQLFSVLVRPNAGVRIYLNFTVEEKNYNKIKKNDRYTETMCPNDGFVFFCNSDLICGQLGKATLGNCNKNGLYSVLLRDYNAHAAACMNRLAMFSARQLGNHVFSIGIDDFKASKKLNQESQKINSDSCKKCDDHIKSYNS